jgi:hypothetical protein
MHYMKLISIKYPLHSGCNVCNALEVRPLTSVQNRLVG